MTRTLFTPELYIQAVGTGGTAGWASLPFWHHVEQVAQVPLQGTDDRVATAIRDAHIRQYVESAAMIAEPVVTTELIRRGGVTSPERSWSALRVDPRVSDQERFAVIDARLRRLQTVFSESARVMMERLAGPNSVPGLTSPITGVRLAGDMHIRGGVAILYQGDRPTLVYKPRSLDTDSIFTDILDRIRQFDPTVSLPRHPFVHNMDGWGLQEYIAYSDPPPESRRTFYQQYGAILALAYVFRITDLHHENIRCTRDGPVIIDMECFADMPFEEDATDPEQDLIFTPRDTVMQTGILPRWSKTFKSAAAYEVSALGFFDHPDRYPLRRVLGDEGGRPAYRYERATSPGPLPHQPIHERGVFPAGAFREDVLHGFRQTFDVLLRSEVRTHLLADIEKFRDSASYGRVVPMGTATYVALLQSPTLLPDPSGEESELRTELRKAENFSISSGVVPLFERDLHTGDVLLDTGAVVTTAVRPIASIARRLAQLTLQDRDDQACLITAAFASVDSHVPPSRSTSLALPAVDAVSGMIDVLSERVLAPLMGSRDAPWLMQAEHVEDDKFSVDSAKPGLYRGLAGLALALTVAGITNRRARETSAHLRNALLKSLEGSDTIKRRRTVSLFSGGQLGPLVAIATANDIGIDSISNQQLHSEIARLIDVPYASTDFVSGTGGVIVGIDRLSDSVASEHLSTVRRRLLDDLIADLEASIASTRSEPGLAHGISGLALTLSTGGEDRPRYDETARLLLEMEDQQINDLSATHKARSASWCWGATGQLTARLWSNVESSFTDRLAEDVINADLQGLGICHGLAGPAMLLRTREFRDRFGVASEADRRFRKLMESAATTGARRSGLPPDVGLMTGLSGALLYFCSIRDDASFTPHDLRYIL